MLGRRGSRLCGRGSWGELVNILAVLLVLAFASSKVPAVLFTNDECLDLVNNVGCNWVEGTDAVKHLHVRALGEFESCNSMLYERPRIELEVAHKDGHLENVGKLLLKDFLIMEEQLIESDAVFFDRC